MITINGGMSNVIVVPMVVPVSLGIWPLHAAFKSQYDNLDQRHGKDILGQVRKNHQLTIRAEQRLQSCQAACFQAAPAEKWLTLQSVCTCRP